MLWAEGEPLLYDGDPANGWRRFAGAVDVFSIPGDHMSSVIEHGERVGALIREILAEPPPPEAASVQGTQAELAGAGSLAR